MEAFGYIHTLDDVMLLIHAIRLKLIETVGHKPTQSIKESIRTGKIFCYKNKTREKKRWLDGRSWSHSRAIDKFLVYKEVSDGVYDYQPKKKLKGTPQTKNFFNKSLDFYKKCITFTYKNFTYHIISYYNPIFDKRPISELPFFKKIKELIENNKNFEDEDFVYEATKDMKKFRSKYGLLDFQDFSSMSPDLDREKLEQIAMSVLRYDLKKHA